MTNGIICGNNAQVLAGFPADYIDLTVTSPPYDNLRDYNGYEFDFEAVAQQLWRVTKPGGVVVWVVGDATINGSETGTSFRQTLRFMEIGFNLHDTMIYEKAGGALPHDNKYLNAFEYMFIFSKGLPKKTNLINDRKNRFKRWGGGIKVRDKSGAFSPRKKRPYSEYGRRFNVWRYAGGLGYGTKDRMAYQHPAIFPEALARDHIISWSNPGDLILDPFCGSGTTLKMAKEQGRHYIGIDISPEYCALSQRRVEGAKVPLFVMQPETNGKPKPEQLELLPE